MAVGSCYVCLNAVSALYQLIPIDSSQLKDKIKRLDQTIKTSILSGIFAWDKVVILFMLTISN